MERVVAADTQAANFRTSNAALTAKKIAAEEARIEAAHLRSLRMIEQEEIRFAKARDQRRQYDLQQEEAKARRLAQIQRDSQVPTIGRLGLNSGLAETPQQSADRRRAEEEARLIAQMRAGTLPVPTPNANLGTANLQAGTQATSAYAAAQAQAASQTQSLTATQVALGI